MPIIFCAVIICGTLLISFIFKKADKLPALDANLEKIAMKFSVRLDDSKGAFWRNEINSAAGGFALDNEKDARLEEIVKNAIIQKRLDAGCMAAALIKEAEKRSNAFRRIYDIAILNCNDLPWGVFAIKGINDTAIAEKLITDINMSWQECAKKAIW